MSVEPVVVDVEGVALSCVDSRAQGPPVLLLHGLAGYAGEWTETVSWLKETHRPVAFDARGHGLSERLPADVSRAAHLSDAVQVIERLGLALCVVVGQSLGGVTALLLAARRPDLVRALVLIEAGPAAGPRTAADALGDALSSWPVPFDSRDAAVRFFGGPSLAAESWAGGLEQRDDGLWPRFDIGVMTRTLADANSRSYWSEWEQVACPALIVRGEHGTLSRAEMLDMIARNPRASAVEIAAAGHDVHLDSPAEWQSALKKFLGSLADS